MGDRKPKPLTTNQLHNLAELCTLLATELRADHAPGTQALLHTETTTGYPRSSSGASTPGSGDNTPTEAAALHTDHTATNARNHLNAQHQLWHYAALVLTGLQTRNPNRSVKVCNRCGHPMTPGRVRCQRIDPDTGLQCAASEDALPDCIDCGGPCYPGERFRDDNNRDRFRCRTCHRHLKTKGYTKASAAKYRDSFDQMVQDEGVYAEPN